MALNLLIFNKTQGFNMMTLKLQLFTVILAVVSSAYSHTDHEKMIIHQNNFDFSKDMTLPPYSNSVLKNISFNLGNQISKSRCPTNGKNPITGVSVAEVGAFCSLSGEGPKLELASESVTLSFWHSKGKSSDHFKLINTHATLFDKELKKERLQNKLSIPANGGDENIDTICKAMGYESGKIIATQKIEKAKALVFSMKNSKISDITNGDAGETILGKKEVRPLNKEVNSVSEFECARSSIAAQIKKQLGHEVFYNDITNGNTRKLFSVKRERVSDAKTALNMLPEILRTHENKKRFELEISISKNNDNCEDLKHPFFRDILNLNNHISGIK